MASPYTSFIDNSFVCARKREKEAELMRQHGSRANLRTCSVGGAALAATCALTLFLSITFPHAAFADGLPAQAVPAGFQSVDNAAGGRILAGTLGDMPSAPDAFRSGLHNLKRYFGGTMEITSAVRSQDGQTTAAFFCATLHGTPITGLSFIAFAKEGTREAVLFDSSAHFAKTLPSLIERLKVMPLPTPPHGQGATTTKVAHVALPPLHPKMASDGTVGISIPSDWQVKYLQSGTVIVTGPGKQRVAVNGHRVFLDPRSPRVQRAVQTAQFTRTRTVLPEPVAQYTTDVSRDFVNAFEAVARSQKEPDPEIHIDTNKSDPSGATFLAGTRLEAGVKMRFAGLASAMPVGNGAWSLSWWMIFDTPEDFPQAAPLLLAIEQSCKYNGQADRKVKAEETAQFIRTSQAAMEASQIRHDASTTESERRFKSSMAAARASQDAIDRSAAGMIRVIQGSSVLEHTDTGAHGTLDATVAQAIAQQDPQHYRVVSQKEYRKGIDY